MTCNDLDNKLDDYLDGALDTAEAQLLDQHVAACEHCSTRVDQENRLRSALRAYGESSAPQPDADYFGRALLRAAHNGSRTQRNRWVMTGFGGAIAAGLAIWVLAGVLLQSPTLPEAGVPQGSSCEVRGYRSIRYLMLMLRPRRRLREIIFLPPTVRILARNPCLRNRLRLLIRCG